MAYLRLAVGTVVRLMAATGRLRRDGDPVPYRLVKGQSAINLRVCGGSELNTDPASRVLLLELNIPARATLAPQDGDDGRTTVETDDSVSAPDHLSSTGHPE